MENGENHELDKYMITPKNKKSIVKNIIFSNFGVI